jgi:hypothetical protein
MKNCKVKMILDESGATQTVFKGTEEECRSHITNNIGRNGMTRKDFRLVISRG